MIPEFFAEQIKPSGMFGIFFYSNTKSSAIACGKLQIIYFNMLVYNALVKIYAAFFTDRFTKRPYFVLSGYHQSGVNFPYIFYSKTSSVTEDVLL